MHRPAADEDALRLHRRLNRTDADYPADRSVKDLFERCAAARPDAVAVVQGERTLTYRELNRRANALASVLLDAGLGPGEVAAVCVDRSPELITALLAVVKCGAGYLPVDREWPDARLTVLFEQAGCRLLITDRAPALRQRFPDRRTVPVGDLPDHDAADPDLRVPSSAIAYINFTSGSTGTPKGVPIRHRSIVRLLFGARYARLDEHTTLLHMAPVTFDAATFEIWGALLHGGTCVLYPPGFVRLSVLGRVLRAHPVSVLFLTTALFNIVVDEAPETLAAVGTILTGGEAHSLRHVRRALELYGPDRLVSVYGPTECTTFATFHPVRDVPPEETTLPIGRPIQNTRAYVVADGRLCGAGETGEVLLGGPGLSPGYLGLPEVTGERFGLYDIGGRVERLYRTGDRAYLRADGELVFQGRTDSQVKINGHRVELSEVAHHLNRHPGVRQSYLTVDEGPAGEKALLAFVVPGDASCDREAVRAFLRTSLPGYMVPSGVYLCDALPLSATGKVDRAALLAERVVGAR